MSKRKYITFRILLLIVLVFMANIIRAEGSWYWALLPIIFAIAVFISIRYLSPKKVKEVMIDERIQLIQEKASRIAIQTSVLTSVVIGAILVDISYEAGLAFSQIGLTLTYSAVTLVLLVIILRVYYSRKL